MQLNYIIFSKNYHELTEIKHKINQPMMLQELLTGSEKETEFLQDNLIEFTRLLHNFLASEKTLVDLTRRWVQKQFLEKPFYEVYTDEINDRFASNVQAQFLNDLRNFTLHRTLPLSLPIIRLQQVSKNTLKSELDIVLKKSYLLEWEKWSELGRLQIMMTDDEEIDILLICSQYYTNVTEFTKWLFWKVREIYDIEVNKINNVVNFIRNINSENT